MFGRKKGGQALDGMGPGDVLLAAAGTLPDSRSRIVMEYVTNNAFVKNAVDMLTEMERTDVLQIDEICRSAMVGIGSLRQFGSSRDEKERELVYWITLKYLQILGHSFDPNQRIDETSVIFAGVRGAARMTELRREDQAISALTLALIISAHITKQKSGSVKIYVATWGEQRSSKCTFFVDEKGGISFKPETHEPSLIADDRISSALTELEVALGRKPSSSANLEANFEFLKELIHAGKVQISQTQESIFHWEPALPTSSEGLDRQ